MQQADSTARHLRPTEDAILRALERLAEQESVRARHRSGLYAVVDEFAGLDRLDRDELDEE